MSMFGVAASVIFRDGQVLLIKENYGRRRYGLPGGRIESAEGPRAAAAREVTEETGLEVAVRDLVGVYVVVGRAQIVGFVYLADVVGGVPMVPPTGEIAEVGWFDPAQLPEPLTNITVHALTDAIAGRRGVVRDDIEWRPAIYRA
jgi:8-oxo-dGTP diphosphatase